MSDSQDQTIQKYSSLLALNASSHVIRAAMQSGLLSELTQGQRRFGELVEVCDVQPDLANRVLDVLIALGLVEQYGEHFAASQVLHLLSQNERDLGDHFLESLPVQLRGDSRPDTITEYRRSVVARAWTRTPLALQAAAALDIGGSRKDLRILEIGGGASVWSSAIAFRDPGASVVSVDTPESLGAAREMMESIQLSTRWTPFEADPTIGELPDGPFDLVLVPELLMTQDDDNAVFILGRAADVTRPSGEVVVLETFEPETADAGAGTSEIEAENAAKQQSLATAIRQLELGLRTPMGRLRQASECSRLMSGAGLESIQYAQLKSDSETAGILIGSRPDTLI